MTRAFCLMALVAVRLAGAEIAAGPQPAVRLEAANEAASIRITGAEGRRVEARGRDATGREVAVSISVADDVVTIASPVAASNLEITVPRKAKINLDLGRRGLVLRSVSSAVEIRSGSGHVVVDEVAAITLRQGSATARVTRVHGPARIWKESGELAIDGVRGSVALDMKSGNATLRRIGGNVEAATATANVDAREVQGDVTVVSINGFTTLECVHGAVNASDTNGVIEVRATEGDVMIDTTSGRATWSGAPRPGHRYRMRTLSGALTLAGRARPDAAITLSTHFGHIATDLALAQRDSSASGRLRRLTGTVGGGRAQIHLDAFEGTARLRWDEGEIDETCDSDDAGLWLDAPGKGTAAF